MEMSLLDSSPAEVCELIDTLFETSLLDCLESLTAFWSDPANLTSELLMIDSSLPDSSSLTFGTS